MLKLEHAVWVIVAKDRDGQPRGFEKTDERFFLIEEEAHRHHGTLGDLKPYFTVAEARIGYPHPAGDAFVANMDWTLLREQKELLQYLVATGIQGRQTEYLEGLVHFLDHFQDRAVEVGIDESIVFGRQLNSTTEGYVPESK